MNILKTLKRMKRDVPELDVNYYLSRYNAYPSMKWFLPTNDGDQDFQICNELFERGAMERKPVLKGQSLIVYFKKI